MIPHTKNVALPIIGIPIKLFEGFYFKRVKVESLWGKISSLNLSYSSSCLAYEMMFSVTKQNIKVRYITQRLASASSKLKSLIQRLEHSTAWAFNVIFIVVEHFFIYLNNRK